MQRFIKEQVEDHPEHQRQVIEVLRVFEGETAQETIEALCFTMALLLDRLPEDGAERARAYDRVSSILQEYKRQGQQ
jgi:hypothetical protein